MTKTEKLKKELDEVMFQPISWVKGSRHSEEPTTYISGTSRDQLVAQILIACKESGLMFTEKREGFLEEGGMWWERTVITDPIEVE